jgi:6-pyruvoyltetrahydropterin/6-carboxytetrahydropterin synthase
MPKFQSTKTYGTDRGLSCCFRQWKANHSHCSTLHGYSLGFKFVWESETLDEKNWCFDFGGMKPIKQYLDHMFDHTILVAIDDPALDTFKALAAFSLQPELNGVAPEKQVELFNEGRVCNLRIVAGVGCELTAKLVYEESAKMLEKMKSGELGRYAVNPDVRLVSVECFEHGANSAIYYG